MAVKWKKLPAFAGCAYAWITESTLNRSVGAWANYFCLGTITKAYRQVTGYLHHRVRQWLVRKHKLQGSKRSRYSATYLHGTLVLLRLQRRANRVSWTTV